MMFQIDVEERSTGRTYTIRSDKTTMFVSIMPSFVSTCVDNSSARVWRRGGRTFHVPVRSKKRLKHTSRRNAERWSKPFGRPKLRGEGKGSRNDERALERFPD